MHFGLQMHFGLHCYSQIGIFKNLNQLMRSVCFSCIVHLRPHKLLATLKQPQSMHISLKSILQFGGG